MLDIKFVRDNPDAVKENIKKKFQDAKLPLVDEVIEKDAKYRECLKEVESLKAARNKLSKANGPLFGQLKKCTDEAQKAQLQAQIDANNAAVKADADKMAELEAEEAKLADRIQEIMYTIPQMIYVHEVIQISILIQILHIYTVDSCCRELLGWTESTLNNTTVDNIF